jgi:serine/threonine-protein kinase
VPVFDVGEHEGVPFLVMEFVKGETLDFAMKKGERFSLERVAEIGEQIAEALGYAHQHGVIHRDIKPANILLTSVEAYGSERPKITDFGVAKLIGGGITTTGQLLGTPAFMAPEQFTGAPIDGRADLFSLGVILYWMATGEQPFPGETMTAVSYKIVHTEPVPPAKLNPAIPAKMESVILKCLAKSPANRYQTGEELAHDLALLCADSKASSLQSTAPLATGTGKASEETFDLNPGRPSKPLPVTEITAMEMPPPPAKKHGALLVAAAVLLVAMAAGGGYLLAHHRQPAAQPANPAATASTQPAFAPLPALTVEPETAPVVAKKPAGGRPAPPTALPGPLAQTPSVAFDPKTLDPRQNTRLKLELDHFPAGLAFTVAMNGKTYFKGSAGNKAEYENLFVPPGVHEFRVTVRGGGIQKASNIVSAEFLANKRMTLKLELRPPAKGSPGASPALDPAAQIVASLKAEGFFR